jgi:diguanylate cyclase (GGDEF)-like protein
MSLTNNLIINIYSILILLVIYHQNNKFEDEKKFNNKIFRSMMQLTFVLLFLDILSRFDGYPDSIYPILNHTGNFLIFLFNPLLASLWLLYVHYQLFNDEQKTKKIIIPIIVINFLNAMLVILNQFFGWFYTINKDNIYSRGPYFLLPAIISVIIIVISIIWVIKYRNEVEKRNYMALALFAVPPLFGILLQLLFYGISLVLNSMVLSILIAYLFIQNQSISIDHLTGLYNRKRCESYMKEKINAFTKKRRFSGIMLDINNFKKINDTFGHDTGDEALIATGKLLKSCIRANDFLSRFGGDEFVLVLDIDNEKELESTINRINNKVEEFNNKGSYPFKLSFSMGYAVYDFKTNMGYEGFIKLIDQLMYEDKDRYRQSKLFQ